MKKRKQSSKNQSENQNQTKEQLNLQGLKNQKPQKLPEVLPDNSALVEVDNNYLEQIQKIRTYSSEQLDKQIVYLAGGGLVFTIGFIKNIVDISKSTNLTLLFVAWILFVTTLVLNLVSHKSSIKAMDLELQLEHKKSDSWDNATDWLNSISILSLVLAIILFIIFVSLNIQNNS